MRWRSVGYEWAAVLFFLSILLAIQYFRPEWMGIDLGPATRDGRTYQAIDGDSFRAGDVEIRLYGIDAPEYRQDCRDATGASHACGKMARDALSKLLRNKNITCKIIDRDRYGRQVSVCKDGGLEINREIVRLGWATAYRKHSSAYISAEQEAKSAQRGIWAWRFEMPEAYRKRNRALEGGLVSDD